MATAFTLLTVGWNALWGGMFLATRLDGRSELRECHAPAGLVVGR